MRTHVQVGSLATITALDLGPEHPTRAGLVDLHLDVDDGVVSACDIQPGHLHRGAEKLFEVRDYRQVLMLADRHDWQSPFSGELGAALVCEQLWGLSAPPRAVVLRTLLAETARIASHLAFLSFIGHAVRDDDPVLAGDIRRVRERFRVLMLALSGNRLHPMLNRLGGLSEDAPAAWLDSLQPWLDDCVAVAGAVTAAAEGPRFDAAGGLGVLDAATIDQYGVSGPAARASGVLIDLRRSPGYLAYDRLSFDVPAPAGSSGDALARLLWLAHEIVESASLVRQAIALAEQTPGPVNVKLAKIIKLPDAETRLTLESPWGLSGYHLVSRGDRTPWRLALRTPTFANVQALQHLLVGTPIDQLDVVVASLAWTTGDLDK